MFLAKCMAKNGWRQWLLPNMVIHGQYAHGAASARERFSSLPARDAGCAAQAAASGAASIVLSLTASSRAVCVVRAPSALEKFSVMSKT